MPSLAESYFVSFSGGADSTALLLWAACHLKNVHAVHFEHGLRGTDSLNDADFCRRFCKARNISLTVIPLDVPNHKRTGEGDEAAARRLRLDAWKSYLADKSNSVVLLGHHADDVAETMLQRFLRGSNVSGLTALRSERMVNGILFRRPLLHWTRAEVEAYLRENGIAEWCTDQTNAESEFLRNYLRNVVLPPLYDKFPYAHRGIAQSAKTLADDADFIESAVVEHYELCRHGDVREWRKLHPALLVRILRRFVSESIEMDFLPNHNDIERLASALEKSDCKTRISLSGGQYDLLLEQGKISVKTTCNSVIQLQPRSWAWQNAATINYGAFVLVAEILPPPVSFVKDRYHAYFDMALMPESLNVSLRYEGDVIQAFDGHAKSLKKLFIDNHIPSELRSQTPVLRLADGQILFVPGIQTSSFARVTDSTQHVLHIVAKHQ